MKTYTDLEQSKKLAEILPLESADMFYSDIFIDGKHKYNFHYLATHSFKTFEDTKQVESKNLNFLPCWSLTALLSILPTIDNRNAEFCKDIRYNKWHIYYHSTVTSPVIDTARYENLIDACYEMILKLHELEML